VREQFLEAKIAAEEDVLAKLVDLPRQHALLVLQQCLLQNLRHLPRSLPSDEWNTCGNDWTIPWPIPRAGVEVKRLQNPYQPWTTPLSLYRSNSATSASYHSRPVSSRVCSRVRGFRRPLGTAPWL
jgi:hypothetical protein